MKAITESDVVKACQVLFGNDIDISRDFLYYSIHPAGVKSAYRKKAMENHPDFFAAGPLRVQQQQTALFREILHAYDVLTLFFKQREEGAWRRGARKQNIRPGNNDGGRRSRTASDTAGAGSGGVLYRGALPQRTLQIGQYLYYRGRITFEALIKALVWQRKQRPSIGDIAVQWRMLDAASVDRIFRICGKPRLFGEKAVELGLLTVFQVNTILLYQRSLQHRLGTYFVRNNIVTPDELEQLARELKEHNARLLAESMKRRHRGHAFA